MDTWDKFLEDCIKDDRALKRQSREMEIHTLEHSDNLSSDIVQSILRQEKELREILDEDIGDHRQWLMQRKEVSNEQT